MEPSTAKKNGALVSAWTSTHQDRLVCNKVVALQCSAQLCCQWRSRGGPNARGSIWQFYHKRQRLGSGAFGVVREGWDRFVGVHVAIKKVKLRATEHGEMSRDPPCASAQAKTGAEGETETHRRDRLRPGGASQQVAPPEIAAQRGAVPSETPLYACHVARRLAEAGAKVCILNAPLYARAVRTLRALEPGIGLVDGLRPLARGSPKRRSRREAKVSLARSRSARCQKMLASGSLPGASLCRAFRTARHVVAPAGKWAGVA